MTIETRKLVKPSDIVAVEFECKKCGARLVLPLATLDKVATICASCQDQFVIHNSEAHGKLNNLIQRLREHAKADNEPYVLHFQVKDETPKA